MYELIEVTQADRDAAADYMRVSQIGTAATLRRYTDGGADDSNFVQAFARHRQRFATPAPIPEDIEGLAAISSGQLTAEYLAMTPLQKWETLALNGLLGTDEPWIEDMRQVLRTLAGERARLREALEPFANTPLPLHEFDATPVTIWPESPVSAAPSLSYGHFRRAGQALASTDRERGER